MKELPLGYYSTFQSDRWFWPHLLQNHKAKLEVICLQKSYCAPPHGRRGKRNWLWQRLSLVIACSWNMFLFIQSSVKIAILLIKTHLSKSFMLQSKRKTNWNDQCLFWGLISWCALCLQSTCKHNGNHGTTCVQYKAKIQTLPQIQDLQRKAKMQCLRTAFDRLPQWALNLVAAHRRYYNRNV